ncbi:hypothetical protein P154DRAFT_243241 [Amniculicola lignicola CBS 123094]|uniref:Uncharacterized protein n=1 Tax=Amniculicola lignicola CBS 123094 TaxID=1392246 RepID=A0A6A5WM65_9PLEO|nr:hypothetical protein P154DRAFT_243241 [Amniculicola lignicola CBS 123094]
MAARGCTGRVRPWWYACDEAGTASAPAITKYLGIFCTAAPSHIPSHHHHLLTTPDLASPASLPPPLSPQPPLLPLASLPHLLPQPSLRCPVSAFDASSSPLPRQDRSCNLPPMPLASDQKCRCRPHLHQRKRI